MPSKLVKILGEYRIVQPHAGFFIIEVKTGQAALGEDIWNKVCDLDQDNYYSPEQIQIPQRLLIELCHEINSCVK